MWTDTHRYRGMSVRPRAQMRVVPRKEVAFRPCFVWDEGYFFRPYHMVLAKEATTMLHNQDTYQHNANLRLLITFVSCTGSALFPLTVLQSFLLGKGLSYDDLALYSTLGTVATALVLFLLPGLADAVKQFSSFRRMLVAIASMLAITPLTLLLIRWFAPDMPGSTAFVLITLAHVLSSILHSGLSATFDPKGMVRLGLSGSHVTRLVGLVNLTSYSASILSSLIIPFFTNSTTRDPYLWLPALSVCGILTGAALMFLYRPGDHDAPAPVRKHISPVHICRQIFPLPQFRLLMVPNVLRSVGDSVRAFLTPIGLVAFAHNPAAVGWFTIASSVGGTVGCLLLVLLQKRVNLGRLYLLSTTAIGVVLVASCVINSLPLYTLAVALSSTGFMLYGALPAVVTYKYVPNDVIGSFTALRLFILNLFNSAFGYVIGVILDWNIPFLPLSIAALCAYFASGILFQSACRKMDAANHT